MCRSSLNLGETKVWCGMGWTGQPTIVEREDRTWAIFGGYDGHIHFMDASTGERILPDVVTDDIIKGPPTIDPDGFPPVYSGSRDNYIWSDQPPTPLATRLFTTISIAQAAGHGCPPPRHPPSNSAAQGNSVAVPFRSE